MIFNYLKISVRQLTRDKFYSTINILGLAVGLASCLLIITYVSNEFSYDQFHSNKDRIYRISEIFRTGDGTRETGLTPYSLASDLQNKFPQIEKFARIDFDIQRLLVQYGDLKFSEESITSSESEFFDIFSFELLKGDKNTLLDDPYTVVISDEKAHRYFQAEDPIGKVLEFTDPYSYESFEAKITGVFRSMPEQSHFHRDIILSEPTANILIPERMDEMGWTSHFSYLLLNPETDPVAFEEDINKHFQESYPQEVRDFISHFRLQSLNDIHLRSHLKEELEVNGDITYVYIFSLIALIIIIIAGINYMNLATARAVERAREVGVRKVAGASRSQLITQFLAESVVITLMSLLLAVVLVTIAQPAINHLSGKELAIDWMDPLYLSSMILATVLIGVFAGSYPAFFLSRFQPMKVLKGALAKTGSQSLLIRRGLVVAQFAISTLLIIGTLIIYKQWNFLKEQKFGIASEYIIQIPAQSEAIQQQYTSLKNELLKNPQIVSITGSRKKLTTRIANYTNVTISGESEAQVIPWNYVDHTFFRTFGIPIVEGQDFSRIPNNDTLTDIILNEAAVQQLGLEEPINKVITAIGREGKIIGVTKDFNFESLHTPISPVIFIPSEKNLEYILVQVKSADLDQTIALLADQYRIFDPRGSFSYTFLDDDINRLYVAESTFFRIFSCFAILAIFIACLGIMGLAAFMASQRKREFGIRKVLGASATQISALLTREFLILVILANVIACPLAYLLMQGWLDQFPYRTEIGYWIFVLASLVGLTTALGSAGIQAIRAGLSNPIESIRSE